jgi:hypothetical protein
MKKSARFLAWRNLCVAGINAGLDKFEFGLEPGQNSSKQTDYKFTIGAHEVFAVVSDIGYDELSFHFGVGKRAMDKWSGADAFAHCWLERRKGRWIQTHGKRAAGGFHCKRTLIAELAALQIEPDGYADHGKFFF